MRVEGRGSRVEGSGFRVQGSRFTLRVKGLGVLGIRFQGMVQGVEFRVSGFG